MEEKIKMFFDELSELTRKYGFDIDGCGCCGSPYLSGTLENYVVDDIKWREEENAYAYDIYKQREIE